MYTVFGSNFDANTHRLIRLDARPGTEERPLIHVQGNFWRMEPDYLTD